MLKKTLVALLTVVLLGFAATAGASVIFTASDSFGRSAEADFAVVGSSLLVKLSNTSTQDVLVPTQVLTALFFTMGGAPLNPGTAVLPAGNTVINGPLNGGNVGGEWGYKDNLSGAPLGATDGISSSGLGLFGFTTFFDFTNLQGPAGLDGLQYGITSAGDNTSTGNGGIQNNALIKNSVLFTFSNFTGDINRISNVSFQYGTALTEPNIHKTPEPGMMVLFGSGLLGLGFFARKRFQK